jgi:hypothetical protein
VAKETELTEALGEFGQVRGRGRPGAGAGVEARAGAGGGRAVWKAVWRSAHLWPAPVRPPALLPSCPPCQAIEKLGRLEEGNVAEAFQQLAAKVRGGRSAHTQLADDSAPSPPSSLTTLLVSTLPAPPPPPPAPPGAVDVGVPPRPGSAARGALRGAHQGGARPAAPPAHQPLPPYATPHTPAARATLPCLALTLRPGPLVNPRRCASCGRRPTCATTAARRWRRCRRPSTT